jgi:hypothetical protein
VQTYEKENYIKKFGDGNLSIKKYKAKKNLKNQSHKRRQQIGHHYYINKIKDCKLKRYHLL